MANQLTHKQIEELGINPHAAKLLAESYLDVLQKNLGNKDVGAMEFMYSGSPIIISLRHKAMAKVVEGIPAQMWQAGLGNIILAMLSWASEKHDEYFASDEDLEEAHSRLLEELSDKSARDAKPVIDATFDFLDMLKDMKKVHTAVKENNPKLLKE